MSFGRRDSQKSGAVQSPARSRQGSNDPPSLDTLAAEMRQQPTPGMSLTTKWMIVGPIMLLLIALLVMFPKGGETDPVEVAAVAPQAIDGGYIQAPTPVPRSGDPCSYMLLRVTSDVGGIVRSLHEQSCPSAGLGYTEMKIDCKNGRRWTERYGETLDALNTKTASSRWEYLVDGSSAMLVSAAACQKTGLKLIINS